MPQALASAVLKREIESRLANRIPGALSPPARHRPRLLPTGVPSVDTLLRGGLPIGAIHEFTGDQSCGRTSLALATLAEASQEGACAYIDTSDCLDPFTAAAAGVRLENLLWVRLQSSGTGSSPVRDCHAQVSNEKTGAAFHPTAASPASGPEFQADCRWKAEKRLRRQEGTPGHPNQTFGLVRAPQEQIAYERMLGRGKQAVQPLRAVSSTTRILRRLTSATAIPAAHSCGKKPWSLLDHAIRATDRVLQSGGFRIVVLDLASILPEQSLRIPSATWFRFRRAAQESDAILLLLTRQPCAQSSAASVLHCSPGSVSLQGGLLSGLTQSVELVQQRFAESYEKKNPCRVTWETTPEWMRTVNG